MSFHLLLLQYVSYYLWKHWMKWIVFSHTKLCSLLLICGYWYLPIIFPLGVYVEDYDPTFAHCNVTVWNPLGNGLSYEQFDFPIFSLKDDDETQLIRQVMAIQWPLPHKLILLAFNSIYYNVSQHNMAIHYIPLLLGLMNTNQFNCCVIIKSDLNLIFFIYSVTSIIILQ